MTLVEARGTLLMEMQMVEQGVIRGFYLLK